MNFLYIIIILVVVLAVILFFLLKKKKPKTEATPSAEGTIEEPAVEEEVPAPSESTEEKTE